MEFNHTWELGFLKRFGSKFVHEGVKSFWLASAHAGGDERH
jgi:hypothetical protein